MISEPQQQLVSSFSQEAQKSDWQPCSVKMIPNLKIMLTRFDSSLLTSAPILYVLSSGVVPDTLRWWYLWHCQGSHFGFKFDFLACRPISNRCVNVRIRDSVTIYVLLFEAQCSLVTRARLISKNFCCTSSIRYIFLTTIVNFFFL